MTSTDFAETTTQLSRDERLRRFGEEIDAIRKDVEAQIGETDVRRLERLQRFSRAMEIIGRVAIHFSPDPVSFSAGVLSLWIHKQLQATEIGHTVLHGAYDGLPGAERFDSKKFYWDLPIDEESWRAGHNLKHHGSTNVAGRDPDIHFGISRLTPHTPWRRYNRWQLPFTLAVLFPNFAFLMNLHFTGVNDVHSTNGLSTKLDFLPDRSRASVLGAYKRALRKYVPYYFVSYVVFPALAGPFFWKVMLGNWLAETLRDIYSAATIHCGHVGPDVASYPEGTRARSRGEWYAMQVESTNNFEVAKPISILCGGLDRQIEHHLFPKLPPERLRQIAPAVRAACERWGIAYRTDTWGRMLGRAFAHIDRLSREHGALGGAREALREVA
ncbi:MAG: fatty acid desaturase [Deltaproteobacteria bacterium]|nr:fatty acid desaturase [Deltaproteobacteria bacterium]